MFNPSSYQAWQLANAKQIYAFFNARVPPMGLKIHPWHAAAIVENADAESSFEPNVVGDHDAAVGLFQWHLPRRQAMATGLKIPLMTAMTHWTVEQQCEGVWWELTQAPNLPKGAYLKGVLSAFLATENAYDAASVFCRSFEGASAPGQPAKRGNGAVAWLSYLQAHS